jgi:hypothetical protein
MDHEEKGKEMVLRKNELRGTVGRRQVGSEKWRSESAASILIGSPMPDSAAGQ